MSILKPAAVQAARPVALLVMLASNVLPAQQQGEVGLRTWILRLAGGNTCDQSNAKTHGTRYYLLCRFFFTAGKTRGMTFAVRRLPQALNTEVVCQTTAHINKGKPNCDGKEQRMTETLSCIHAACKSFV